MAIKTRILNLIQKIRWSIDCCICRGKTNKRRLSNVPAGKLFVLMPHSDDEWIGCSQLLMNHSENVIVINMDMPGGDNNSLHIARRKESENLAEKYNYKFVTIDGESKEKGLLDLIKDNNPSCIFLPSLYDWHDEHFEVMSIFDNAAELADYSGSTGMYQVSIPIPEVLINAKSSLSRNQQKRKWESFIQYYPSQRFLPVNRFKANERINGAICSQYAIEAYVITSYKTWSARFRSKILSVEDKQKLRKNVNSISIVREICADFYKKTLTGNDREGQLYE